MHRKDMRVLVSGASGLVGRALRARLLAEGHRVHRLARGLVEPASGDVSWDPERLHLDMEALRRGRFDAVVHLAGESIAAGRWTAERRARISASRVAPTELLARGLASLEVPPSVFLTASAVGVYGDRGDEVLDEDSTLPTVGTGGFLADLGHAWEDAAKAVHGGDTVDAVNTGKLPRTRLALARIGVVLDAQGGALPRMLPLFRLGLGGPLGSGMQWMSWIALSDLVGALLFALENEHIVGAFNAVAPEPVRNRDFTSALGTAVRRPAFLPAPTLALRAAFGDMAQETLLASQRCVPKRLLQAGFPFAAPTIHEGIAAALANGP